MTVRSWVKFYSKKRINLFFPFWSQLLIDRLGKVRVYDKPRKESQQQAGSEELRLIFSYFSLCINTLNALMAAYKHHIFLSIYKQQKQQLKSQVKTMQ
jgi:hypothetical protein